MTDFDALTVSKPRWGWSGNPAGLRTINSSSIRNGSRFLNCWKCQYISLKKWLVLSDNNVLFQSQAIDNIISGATVYPCLNSCLLEAEKPGNKPAYFRLWSARYLQLKLFQSEPFKRVGFTVAGLLLEMYFQMVHDTIGRYETPSLHTPIEWEAWFVAAVGRI